MIQHAGIYVSGFIEYDIHKTKTADFIENFDYETYYKDNNDYFQQKYYANWLHTLYPDEPRLREMGLSHLESNHLVLKYKSNDQFSINKQNTEIKFSIGRCLIFLFQETMAIFSIQLMVADENLNFKDISVFTNNIRNTTINSRFINDNPLIPFIQENIIKNIGNNHVPWHLFNPHLKLFLNIDVTEPFAQEQEMDHILFELATVAPIGTIEQKTLYTPSENYYNQLMANNTIHIFNNWKVLCLFDSTVRISVNLKDVDHYNLWENDYYTIYIFTLFIRFYLYQTNAKLDSVYGDIKKAAIIRNNYIQFINNFDITQIAFKFLPDVIYRLLLRSMNIETEMQKLEEKISRINTSVREHQEKNIESLLRIVAVVSLISVINDAWELTMKATNQKEISSQELPVFIKITIAVLFILITAAVLSYNYNKKKWLK